MRRKFLAITLAVAMLFTLAAPVLAADVEPAPIDAAFEEMDAADEATLDALEEDAVAETEEATLDEALAVAAFEEEDEIGEAATRAEAEEDLTIADFAYIHNVNLGFHCRSDGGSGGPSQKIANYARGDEVFGQIATNVWLLLKVVGHDGDTPIFTIDTDYVCPNCGSSRWVSYSNQSDMLGGAFDGKNMQVNHYPGGGTVNISGDVKFTKFKMVDGSKRSATNNEFEFNLYKSNVNGDILGLPLNGATTLKTNNNGAVEFHFAEGGGYAPGDWYIFVEKPAAGWEIEPAYKNGILFKLGLLGNQTLIALWANDAPWGEEDVTNYPSLGSLTVNADIAKQHEKVTKQNYYERTADEYYERTMDEYYERTMDEYYERTMDEYYERTMDEYYARTMDEYFERTADEYYERTMDEFFERTADEYFKRKADEYYERKADEYYERTADEYYERTADEYYERTADEYYERTADEYFERTMDEYFERTMDEYFERTMDEYFERTADEYFERTMTEYFEQSAD